MNELAYFKLPGWILFLDDLKPNAQKIIKHKIFDEKIDPRYLSHSFDLRSQRKRKSSRKQLWLAPIQGNP